MFNSLLLADLSKVTELYRARVTVEKSSVKLEFQLSNELAEQFRAV